MYTPLYAHASTSFPLWIDSGWGRGMLGDELRKELVVADGWGIYVE